MFQNNTIHWWYPRGGRHFSVVIWTRWSHILLDCTSRHPTFSFHFDVFWKCTTSLHVPISFCVNNFLCRTFRSSFNSFTAILLFALSVCKVGSVVKYSHQSVEHIPYPFKTRSERLTDIGCFEKQISIKVSALELEKSLKELCLFLSFRRPPGTKQIGIF